MPARNENPREVLLTWVGSRDPGWHNERTGEKRAAGPVLSLLASKRFDAVYLLYNLQTRSNDDYRDRANRVLRICQKEWPNLVVKHKPVDLVSVTDHREIYHRVSMTSREILEAEPANARFSVFLSPGTPQMQTVWVLLVQSGQLPATMIETTPRDLLLPGEPIWRQVDLSIATLPTITAPGKRDQQLALLEAQVDNLMAENRRLAAQQDLARSGGSEETNKLPTNLPDELKRLERAWFTIALDRSGQNAAEAARMLGLEPHGFRARAQRLGVRMRRSLERKSE